MPEAKEEELVLVPGADGGLTVTRAEVKAMDDDEFDHALTLARSKDTPEGNEQVETLEEWHGKKPAAKDDK
jgi:hypothetical protein